MARRFLIGLVAGLVIIGCGWFVWSKTHPATPKAPGTPINFKRANAEAQEFWGAQDYVSFDSVSDAEGLAATLQGPIDAKLGSLREQERRDLARLIASELWIHRPDVTLDEYIEFVESDPAMRWVDEANPQDAWYVDVLRHSGLEGPLPERIKGEWALRAYWPRYAEKDRIVAIGSGENVFVKPFVAKQDALEECFLALDPEELPRFFPRGVPGSKALTFRVPRVSADDVLGQEGSVRCVAMCMLVKTNLDSTANLYFLAFWNPASGLWTIEYGMRLHSDRVFLLY